jgi:hypothetical protein
MKFITLCLLLLAQNLVVKAQLLIPGKSLANTLLHPFSFFVWPTTNALTVVIGDNAKPTLRWSSTNNSNKEFFYTVERSSNGEEYTVVGVIKNTAPSNNFLQFTDEDPLRGTSYYRIKYSDSTQSYFSEPVSANIAEDVALKFYPNPVDKMLIIRTESPVSVLITDNTNKVLIAAQLEAGLQVVDVSSLATGNYFIKLIQKETNKQIIQALVKK